MVDVALDYLRSGLCPLPAIAEEKRPALGGWKQYQRRLPTEQQVRTWFSESTALCLLTGAVSGNLEMIDFDHEGELFQRWRELVEAESPGLFERLVVEHSQSGGCHVTYRCQTPIPGNRKLAQRTVAVDSAEPVVITGKRCVPRRVGGRYEVTCTLIETRGEGGLFLCDPTPGYETQQGALNDLPELTESERSVLMEAACSLSETLPPVAQTPTQLPGTGRPGDEFNERGDVRDLLCRHGWQLVRGGDNEYWRRPGKERGWSATLRDRVLYVFSSNATPFEPDRGYNPFTVYSLLEHDGDFGAARCGAARGRIWRRRPGGRSVAARVQWHRPSSALRSRNCGPGARASGTAPRSRIHLRCDGPLPRDGALPQRGAGLLRSAVALQAVLAGRKVRDQADNRTNLYLLALAYSSVGKDWPRKVNTHILHRVGLGQCAGREVRLGRGHPGCAVPHAGHALPNR